MYHVYAVPEEARRASDALELELQDELPMWVLETEPGSWQEL